MNTVNKEDAELRALYNLANTNVFEDFAHDMKARDQQIALAAQDRLLKDLFDVGEIHHSVYDYKNEAIEEDQARLKEQHND